MKRLRKSGPPSISCSLSAAVLQVHADWRFPFGTWVPVIRIPLHIKPQIGGARSPSVGSLTAPYQALWDRTQILLSLVQTGGTEPGFVLLIQLWSGLSSCCCISRYLGKGLTDWLWGVWSFLLFIQYHLYVPIYPWYCSEIYYGVISIMSPLSNL